MMIRRLLPYGARLHEGTQLEVPSVICPFCGGSAAPQAPDPEAASEETAMPAAGAPSPGRLRPACVRRVVSDERSRRARSRVPACGAHRPRRRDTERRARR